MDNIPTQPYSPEHKNLLNEQEHVIREQASKTNKYKIRIIESEISSNLFFQILIYYNSFYSVICFCFQIFSLSFKVIYLYLLAIIDNIKLLYFHIK